VHSTGTIGVIWFENRDFSCLRCIFCSEFRNFWRKLGVLLLEIFHSELQCISLLSNLFQFCTIRLSFVVVGRYYWNLLLQFGNIITQKGNLVGDVSHKRWCWDRISLFYIFILRGWLVLLALWGASCSRLDIKAMFWEGVFDRNIFWIGDLDKIKGTKVFTRHRNIIKKIPENWFTFS